MFKLSSILPYVMLSQLLYGNNEQGKNIFEDAKFDPSKIYLNKKQRKKLKLK